MTKNDLSLHKTDRMDAQQKWRSPCSAAGRARVGGRCAGQQMQRHRVPCLMKGSRVFPMGPAPMAYVYCLS